MSITLDHRDARTVAEFADRVPPAVNAFMRLFEKQAPARPASSAAPSWPPPGESRGPPWPT
ncbi:hypothetical protein HII36_03420 [Nonomuraea sp. NN258]|uniref:hypothetical protein n=1 Tax=Nonomuraea antri TaxID=2730852 RepID=UPI0015690EB8|nr:hypothetical protein [Nonomuraea antri]NRQ30889.1 hypothetical protein [Nonomuraea antri]